MHAVTKNKVQKRTATKLNTKNKPLNNKKSLTVATRRNFSTKKAPKQSTSFTSGPSDGTKEIEFVPMRPKLDYRFIKENHQVLQQSMEQRNYKNDSMPEILSLIDRKDHTGQVVQDYRTYRNFLADTTAALTSKRPVTRPVLTWPLQHVKLLDGIQEVDLKAVLEESKAVKAKLGVLETELTEIENNLERLAVKLPNLTHPDVPVGDEANATVLKHLNADSGNLNYYKKNGMIPRSHLDIVRENNLVEFDAAGIVSGSRFYYLKGNAALLEMALINFGLSKLIRRGYTPILPPDMARLSVIEGAGFQSKDEKTLDAQVYRIEGSDLTMCGTAEIPLAGLYLNQVIPEEQLPIKMVGYNHCFRPEAGGHGVNSRGLYRVHQFSKVEMFVLATPEQSDAIHQELIDIETELFTDLGLNFKVLDMPTGDLGAPAYRKIDMEASMPGRAINVYQAGTPASPLTQEVELIDQIGDNFGEISSTSNCLDYQARRLNIRYKPSQENKNYEDGNFIPPLLRDDAEKGKKAEPKTKFVHTLNGTACAIPRLIISIIEQFQEPDGRVRIPEKLRPFMLGGPITHL